MTMHAGSHCAGTRHPAHWQFAESAWHVVAVVYLEAHVCTQFPVTTAHSPSSPAAALAGSRWPVRTTSAIVGGELRTGSASENGEEVVVGTALMLIGANSRTVADDVDAKLRDVQKSLPADVRAKAVLNRRKLVDLTIATVQGNLVEGAHEFRLAEEGGGQFIMSGGGGMAIRGFLL